MAKWASEQIHMYRLPRDLMNIAAEVISMQFLISLFWFHFFRSAVAAVAAVVGMMSAINYGDEREKCHGVCSILCSTRSIKCYCAGFCAAFQHTAHTHSHTHTASTYKNIHYLMGFVEAQMAGRGKQNKFECMKPLFGLCVVVRSTQFENHHKHESHREMEMMGCRRCRRRCCFSLWNLNMDSRARANTHTVLWK